MTENIARPWLKQYRDDIPAHITDIPYKNIGELLTKTFTTYGKKPAFSNFRRTLTFAEVGQRAHAFAAQLQKMGYQPGDRLALMMPNIFQFPICLYGCLLAGVIVVNINPLYTARELKHQLSDSGARGIVIAENFIASLAQIRAELPELKEIIITRFGDEMGWFWSPIVDFYVNHVAKLIPKYQLDNTLNFKELIKEGKNLPFKAPQMVLDDVAFLQYTGGTTGVAKGAILTHANLLSNIEQIDLWIGKTEVGVGDVAIIALPLYHIFCCTVNCLTFPSRGVHSVLVTNPRDIKDFIGILSKYRFSLMTGVNTLFKALLNHENFAKLDFSHLRFVIAGGMPLEKTVSDRWRAVTSNVIIEGYGMTETSPLISVNQLVSKGYTGGIGYPTPSTDVTIRDDLGAILPFGTAGEIWIRGPQVMKGYWQQKKETFDILSPDGWLKTGDIAVMDETGFLRLVDRKKDMILVSGFNVYPSEVEAVLQRHSAILEAICIGVPDGDRGEKVKAFIVLRPGKSLSEAALRLYVGEHLTSYKRPKLYEFRKSLPKTAVGKILRKELIAEEKEKAKQSGS